MQPVVVLLVRHPVAAFLVRPSVWLAAAILIAAAAYIYSQLPPTRIVIATGTKGGFFETSGQAYQASLAKSGIAVELKGRDDTLAIIEAVEDSKSGIDVGFAAQDI